jgi:Kef-type K+ transport system membrane component KefB
MVGGLTTDLDLLKQTFVPSILIAITGILLPIGLSFLLIPLFAPSIIVSKLTAFSAGAALSSTSLGTTFAILSAVKLTSTKVGTVLVTAAMIDDVVGIVMVKVISSLSGTTIDVPTILRPIGVSIAFLVATLIASKVARFMLDRGLFGWYKVNVDGIGFVVTGVVILAMAAAAGYAGTSILFSAYLAGVAASYLARENALKYYEKYKLLTSF